MSVLDLENDVFLAFDFDHLCPDLELAPSSVHKVLRLVFVQFLLPKISLVSSRNSARVRNVVASAHNNQRSSWQKDSTDILATLCIMQVCQHPSARNRVLEMWVTLVHGEPSLGVVTMHNEVIACHLAVIQKRTVAAHVLRKLHFVRLYFLGVLSGSSIFWQGWL